MRSEYAAVYTARDDGDWDLYLVVSRRLLEDDPMYLIGFEDTPELHKIVESDNLDFPDVWSDEDA